MNHSLLKGDSYTFGSERSYSYAPAFRFSREILTEHIFNSDFLDTLLAADRDIFYYTHYYHHQFSNLAFLYTIRKKPEFSNLLSKINLDSQRKPRTTNWKLVGLVNRAFSNDKVETQSISDLLDKYQDESGFIWDSKCSASAQYHIFMTAILLIYHLEFDDIEVLPRLKKAIYKCTQFSVNKSYILFGRGSEQNFGYAALHFILKLTRFNDYHLEKFRHNFFDHYNSSSFKSDTSIYKFSIFDFPGYGYNSEADYFEIENWWDCVSSFYIDNSIEIDCANSLADDNFFLNVENGRIFSQIRHYHPFEDLANTFISNDGSSYIQMNETERDAYESRLIYFRLHYFLNFFMRFKILLDILLKADSGLNRKNRISKTFSQKYISFFELMFDTNLLHQGDDIVVNTVIGRLIVNVADNKWNLKYWQKNWLGHFAKPVQILQYHD